MKNKIFAFAFFLLASIVPIAGIYASRFIKPVGVEVLPVISAATCLFVVLLFAGVFFFDKNSSK